MNIEHEQPPQVVCEKRVPEKLAKFTGKQLFWRPLACNFNLRIQSECKKIRSRNNSVFGHFSRSAFYLIQI